MNGLGAFAFVAVLLFSIGLHELGHLLTAKRFGIKATHYFIGFGPKLWSTTRGETEYGVKALPLGGFVRIAGMNPFEEIAPEDRDRVFKAKPAWQRAIVLAAGSFTHFLLGFVILALVFAISAVPQATQTIDEVTEEFEGGPSPAAAAGLMPGDTIIAVAGERVGTWSETVEALRERPGERTRIRIERDGQRITVTARLADHHPDAEGEIGFLGVAPAVEEVRVSPVVAVRDAGRDLGRGMWLSLRGLAQVFSPQQLGEVFQQLSGNAPRDINDPTTIVGLTGQAGSLAGGGNFSGFFLLIAAFNIFIGVANLLPLPPLDGGHLAVLAYEKVTRREVDLRKLIPITVTVISVFGFLFLALLVLDITQPIQLPQ